jgi:hypothetical protein
MTSNGRDRSKVQLALAPVLAVNPIHGLAKNNAIDGGG